MDTQGTHVHCHNLCPEPFQENLCQQSNLLRTKQEASQNYESSMSNVLVKYANGPSTDYIREALSVFYDHVLTVLLLH
jgi:hypothetical protein